MKPLRLEAVDSSSEGSQSCDRILDRKEISPQQKHTHKRKMQALSRDNQELSLVKATHQLPQLAFG